MSKNLVPLLAALSKSGCGSKLINFYPVGLCKPSRKILGIAKICYIVANTCHFETAGRKIFYTQREYRSCVEDFSAFSLEMT